MQFRLRDADPNGKFISQLRLELLAHVFPREAVAAVLAECDCRTRRQRKRKSQRAISARRLYDVRLRTTLARRRAHTPPAVTCTAEPVPGAAALLATVIPEGVLGGVRAIVIAT